MKVEKLSKGKSKKIILAITIIVLAIGIIYITNSKAKYQVTKSVQIVNGVINYSRADFSLLGVYQQHEKSSSTYDSVNNVPTSGYVLNENKTYCTIGSTKYEGKTNYNKQGITINYAGGSVTFGGVKTANTKCYLYFDITDNIPPAERVTQLGLTVSQSGCPTYPTPTISSAESSATLFCKGQDDDGDTYYFRGKADKNWVKIGNTYWRIIRINGDGTIRLIYNGTSAVTTGVSTQYKTGAFNSIFGDNAYVGLKYTIGVRNGFNTPSDMFNTLNTFYNEYFGSGKSLVSYANKLDSSAGFCGDRTSNTDYLAQTTNNTGGTGANETYYGGRLRLLNSKKPTFKCPDKTNDLYTKTGATQGNKSLTNSIGLMTVDEAMYAGGFGGQNNDGYWLYTNQSYWLMSPSGFGGGAANMCVLYSDGTLGNYSVSLAHGVRPVINLKSNTIFTGNGTTSSPFVVQL